MSGSLVDTVGNELETVLAYVKQQRDQLTFIAHRLTEEQARLTPTVSGISIAWLFKHFAVVELGWIATIQGQKEEVPDETVSDADTLESLQADLNAVGEKTEKVIREVGLDALVAIPQDEPWFPKDKDNWNVRWVMNHLIEEFARHAGHGDIIRESIDGKTMYELQSLVEGWHDQYLQFAAYAD